MENKVNQSKEMRHLEERRLANLRPPFKPGQSGNLAGVKQSASTARKRVMGKAQAKKNI